MEAYDEHVKLWQSLRSDWMRNTLIMPWQDFLEMDFRYQEHLRLIG